MATTISNNVFVCVCVCRLNMCLDLECAGSSAALDKLRALCSSLGSARDQRKAVLDQLHCKHQKIQRFTQVAVSLWHYSTFELRMHVEVDNEEGSTIYPIKVYHTKCMGLCITCVK